MKPIPNRKGVWYFTTIYYCPLCGGESKYIERRKAPRPKKWDTRNQVVEAWDYCGGYG